MTDEPITELEINCCNACRKLHGNSFENLRTVHSLLHDRKVPLAAAARAREQMERTIEAKGRREPMTDHEAMLQRSQRLHATGTGNALAVAEDVRTLVAEDGRRFVFADDLSAALAAADTPDRPEPQRDDEAPEPCGECGNFMRVSEYGDGLSASTAPIYVCRKAEAGMCPSRRPPSLVGEPSTRPTCEHGETEAHDTYTVHMWPPPARPVRCPGPVQEETQP